MNTKNISIDSSTLPQYNNSFSILDLDSANTLENTRYGKWIDDLEGWEITFNQTYDTSFISKTEDGGFSWRELSSLEQIGLDFYFFPIIMVGSFE